MYNYTINAKLAVKVQIIICSIVRLGKNRSQLLMISVKYTDT